MVGILQGEVRRIRTDARGMAPAVASGEGGQQSNNKASSQSSSRHNDIITEILMSLAPQITANIRQPAIGKVRLTAN
jgi:hypothetical protein